MTLLYPQAIGVLKLPSQGVLAASHVNCSGEGFEFGGHVGENTSLLVKPSTSNLVNLHNKETGNLAAMMTIGQRARQRREDLGLTQAQVADACQVSQQAIYQLEADEVRRPRYIDDLAATLRTTKAWLSSGVGDHSALSDPLTPEEQEDARLLKELDPEGWEIVRMMLRREARLVRERLQRGSEEGP